MSATTLFGLAFTAVTMAALPLAYVRYSSAPDKFRKLAWTTAFLTFDLILFGAFTRLTDSGLGCPDWPGCYGHSNPVSAGEHIRAAETALPSGPVTQAKAWIEMLHRYFAMAVGFLIVVLVAMAWSRRRNLPERSPWPATIALAAVCLQGAFGAWTVTMKLQPLIVTLHLLGAMTLLALLVWVAMRETPVPPLPTMSRGLRLALVAGFFALFLQVALGGWVSSNYAVMACLEFPLCQARWVPEMDLAAGFTLWRELGMTNDGVPIPFDALVAVHWVHRAYAVVVLLILGAIAWYAQQVPALKRPAQMLALVLAIQFLTGLSNVVFRWPLALAIAHNAGAALLVALLAYMLVRSHRR
jgi:cytochrome c oxidase assembly protein subunit 15